MKKTNLKNKKIKKYLIPVLLIALPFFAVLSSGWHFEVLLIIGLASVLFAYIFHLILFKLRKSYLFFFKILIIVISTIAIISPSSIYNSTGNSYNSSSSSSSETHICGHCGKSFTGNGWSTIGGEQFQQSSWSGSGYCSKSCAYASQPSKWKN
jgi:hypothetical protein